MLCQLIKSYEQPQNVCFSSSDCMVTANLTLLPKDNRQFSTILGSFTMNTEAGPFLSIRIFENNLNYTSITCNRTHINTREINSGTNKVCSSDVVPWPACPEWRLFHVAVDHYHPLSITDFHHNKTWNSTSISFIITKLEIEMQHFDVSCNSVTPMWKVEAGVPRVINLPCNWDVIHFTLIANKTARPQLTVGNATFPLGPLSASQPCLILSLKRNHTATPRLVTSTRETVVEMGSAITNFTLSSLNITDAFTIQQHLYLQEWSPPTEADSQDFNSWTVVFLVFLWTAAVSNVILFCCLRSFLNQTHASINTPPLNPAWLAAAPAMLLPSLPLPAPCLPRMNTNHHFSEMRDAIYEDIDDY